MKDLLEWIEKEGYVLNKDGEWYSPKHYNGWRKSTCYKPEELVEKYEQSLKDLGKN